MNIPLSHESSGYRIAVDPLQGRVTAYREGAVLASSTQAKVMYETRLPATIYFPAEDVQVPLSVPTELQTFCPFKGTATYRNIEAADGTIPNGVWSYEEALPESAEIRGYVGFMPDAEAEIDLGENTLHDGNDGNLSGPLIDWLLRDAANLPTAEVFTKLLAERMKAQGIAVSRLNVMIWSLHPLIAGKNYVWLERTGMVTTYAPSYEIHDRPAFINSPLRFVSQGLGGVRQRLADTKPGEGFPITEELRAQGASDYVAMPLPFSNGQINVLTLTSAHPDGFSTADLGLIFECVNVISRYYEVFMQRENAQALLETYVGRRSGARVLGGEIRRGDGDEIDAAIMFCDMRNSTRLAEQMGRNEYIALLNQFFETTSTVVDEQGGEVLKFIGDAVLAVFPAGDDAKQACEQALAAARSVSDAVNDPQSEMAFDCSIGIAFGRVTYGNVGSRERLDFTVIGQAANLSARLCDLGKRMGHAIVATSEVVGNDQAVRDLGQVDLHNISRPVHGYAVEPLPTT